MFKKLKEKLADEVKANPRLQGTLDSVNQLAVQTYSNFTKEGSGSRDSLTSLSSLAAGNRMVRLGIRPQQREHRQWVEEQKRQLVEARRLSCPSGAVPRQNRATAAASDDVPRRNRALVAAAAAASRVSHSSWPFAPARRYRTSAVYLVYLACLACGTM